MRSRYQRNNNDGRGIASARAHVRARSSAPLRSLAHSRNYFGINGQVAGVLIGSKYSQRDSTEKGNGRENVQNEAVNCRPIRLRSIRIHRLYRLSSARRGVREKGPAFGIFGINPSDVDEYFRPRRLTELGHI